MNKESIKSILEKELSEISMHNKKIAVITLQILEELTDDDFWTKPASATGVHHPKTSNCIGGNIIHTKQAFWIGTTILNTISEDFISSEKRACVLSAILLHDIDKFNESLENHGITASEKILKYKNATIFPYWIVDISLMVKYHMGKWGAEQLNDISCRLLSSTVECIKIVHLSDYLSSRPFLEFNESEVAK